MATIDRAAEAITLPAEQLGLIDKARRVVAKQVGHIAFFHQHVSRRLASFTADETLAEAIWTRLIPPLYSLRAARRAASAADRQLLEATCTRLLLRAREALEALPASLLVDAEQLAADCVEIFVRGTSCVEGRNGQLALRHHSLHRLSDRCLTALTVIHNYHLRRPDGSTAAQRFFRADHDDLFTWLLDHLDVPARPRLRHGRRAA